MPVVQTHTASASLLKDKMIRRWAMVSLGFLIIVALMGAFLRLFYVAPIEGINYKNFLHGHSHVAFLGWIFNALYALLVFVLIRDESKLTFYNRLFWAFQITVLGMLVLFPLQGYAAASIIVSTLHILLSYVFAWRLLKDRSAETHRGGTHRFSYLIFRFAILLMILSSIGPFALGPIMASGLRETAWYPMAIYFYLHFQYNGWFFFAVLGLFFFFLEQQHIRFSVADGKTFFLLNAVAVIPAYALSALWTQPAGWVYVIAGVSALLQLVSLLYLFRVIAKVNKKLRHVVKPASCFLLSLVVISLVLKNVLQALEALPVMADLAYRVKNFVIAYLHLNFIGIISFFLLAYFIQLGWIRLKHPLSRAGGFLFLAGFILSELALVVQPSLNLYGFRGIPQYFDLLFYLSLLMPLGLGLAAWAEMRHNDKLV